MLRTALDGGVRPAGDAGDARPSLPFTRFGVVGVVGDSGAPPNSARGGVAVRLHGLVPQGREDGPAPCPCSSRCGGCADSANFA